MNVNHHQTKKDRSYFEWDGNMQIIRKGKGDIAMTESELIDFFNVTLEKPLCFDPFGQTGLLTLAII